MKSFLLLLPAIAGVVHALPSAYDAYSKVSDNMKTVLDQGSCGSCWSFSVTQQLSARVITFQPDSTLASFGGLISPEIPVSLFGIGGCNGGSPSSAVQHIQGKGLPEIECAQYLPATHDCVEGKSSGADHGCTSISANTCYSDTSTAYHTWGFYNKAYVNGVQSVKGFADMQNDVYTWGPLSVMISVTQEFYNYKSGIYSFNDKVLPGKHEVLMTGWGSADSSVKKADTYWRVKNSWTSNWGENGFFSMWAGYNCLSIEESGTSIRFGRNDAEFESLQRYTPPLMAMNVSEVLPGAWVTVDLDLHRDLIDEASKALEMQQGAKPVVKKVEAQVVSGYNMKLHASVAGKTLKAVARMLPNNDQIDGPRFEIIDVHEYEDVVV